MKKGEKKFVVCGIATSIIGIVCMATSLCVISDSRADKEVQAATITRECTGYNKHHGCHHSSKKEQEKEDDSVKQYVMYIGTNDKDTNKLEYTKEEIVEKIDNICLDRLDGYTITEAEGRWKNSDGEKVTEMTFVCYFDGADEEVIKEIADEVLVELNQESVLIETGDINMEFYSKS